MDYSKNWETIKLLGEGGQGKVYLVRDKSRFVSEIEVRTAIRRITATIAHESNREQDYKELRRCMTEMIKAEDPSNQGALKVLHSPEDARDANLANERIEREIEAMSNIKHPNLVQILEVDQDSLWYVSKYYPNGTLLENNHLFIGDFQGALKAIRPLVEAVAELHKHNCVHRDIKPHNIFLDKNNKLILGDFGLVYFSDNQHTRISATYENVGSRDWMPPWAMGIRIEDIKPTFDVFALGKLLWSMITGIPVLQLWYFDRPRFNVVELFPTPNCFKFANRLFENCIVEEEKDCLPNAEALLEEIDKTILLIEFHADPIGIDIKRRCKVCGEGIYNIIANDNASETRNFGITPVGDRKMKIFECSNCGHIQLFSYNERPPKAWLSTKK